MFMGGSNFIIKNKYLRFTYLSLKKAHHVLLSSVGIRHQNG